MRRRSLLLAAALLGLAITSALAGPAALAAVPMIEPDHSLTTAGYMVLGMPTPDHAWGEGELRSALRVLHKIAKRDPSKLPRLESQASGSVFARLIAPDAVPPSDHPTPTAPPTTAERVGDISAFVQQQGRLALLYVNQMAGGGIFDAELVVSTRVALEKNAQLMGLINLQRGQLEGKPVPRKLRRQHEQVVYGADLTIRGALFIYSARRAFRPEWQKRMVGDLVKWLPTLLGRLPAKSQRAALRQMQGLMLEDLAGYKEWDPLQTALVSVLPGPPEIPKPKRHKKRKPPPFATVVEPG